CAPPIFSARDAPASARRPAAADSIVRKIQLGAFADSARARALADSLTAEGWVTEWDAGPTEAGGRTGPPVFRVQVTPPQSGELPALALRALRGSMREAFLVSESASVVPRRVTVVPVVARGTHGMIALTRWTFSPDRCAILVVEDPAAVEAEALPDGFVYASERDTAALQVDGVWDVAPAPDWRRLAYGEGTVVSAGERDSLSAAQWDSLARRFAVPPDSVRAAAFPASGMAIAEGFARTFVVPIGADERPGTPRRVPGFGGWRVGWTPDGGTLAVGAPPRRVQDDEPPSDWIGVSPVTLERRGPLAPGTVAPVEWVEGPMLDIVPAERPVAPAAVAVEGVTFRARDGWIVADVAGGATEVVAPGVPLAATRSGGWVVALVPVLDPRPYDHRVRLVVLRMGR
ncbi:MAG TPA: SPOR domain-containing protein, partial [Gemmatimonadaceae bacterium]|nr:SPOR domain-containing protein [Gemmatimonadaceae bacterium]